MVTAPAFTNEIATAPGDLPLAEIEARDASRRTQFRHDNTIEPLGPGPDEPVRVLATSGDCMPVASAALFYTTDGSLPVSTSTRIQLEAGAIEWEPLSGYLTRWQGSIPGLPAGTIVRYRIGGWLGCESSPQKGEPDIWAHDGQGFWFHRPGGITTFAYSVESGPVMPVWARDAIIYQIFLDRFHPGNEDGSFLPGLDPRGFHGGTLRGVECALPHLAELGVTCLWLSPISASPTYHRYDTTDYYTVDPGLGSNDDLRSLTGAAHARGMRIMLDFVPSHLSWQHPDFIAARGDRAAPSASWFTFDEWPDRYRMFLEMSRTLPSTNTEDPGMRAHIIDAAVQWLREYGVDAFRLDHAIGPGMDFWVAFRRATRAVDPEVFTVGEATDTPDSLRRYRNRLDAVLDFPLASALRQTFGRGEWSISRFDTFLRSYSRYMEDGPGRVSFLDNHDMDRFLLVAGGDLARLRLAALCQFTLEPPPVVYYGTEIAIVQERGMAEIGSGGDSQARGDMPWDETVWDRDLLQFYRALIALRADHAALRCGARRTVHLDDSAGTYAYVRSTGIEGREPDDVLVAFNLGSAPAEIPLPPGHWRRVLSTGQELATPTAAATLDVGSGMVMAHSFPVPAQVG